MAANQLFQTTWKWELRNSTRVPDLKWLMLWKFYSALCSTVWFFKTSVIDILFISEWMALWTYNIERLGTFFSSSTSLFEIYIYIVGEDDLTRDEMKWIAKRSMIAQQYAVRVLNFSNLNLSTLEMFLCFKLLASTISAFHLFKILKLWRNFFSKINFKSTLNEVHIKFNFNFLCMLDLSVCMQSIQSSLLSSSFHLPTPPPPPLTRETTQQGVIQTTHVTRYICHSY